MKKRRGFFAVLLAALLLLPVLTACGGSAGGSGRVSYETADEAEGYSYDYDYGNDMAAMSKAYDRGTHTAGTMDDSLSATLYADGEMVFSSSVPEEPAAPGEAPAPDPSESRPRKLIRTASITQETTSFDETVAAIADLTTQYGGYFEQNVTGERGSGRRWASYTIRVPEQYFQTFLSKAGELCHTTGLNWSQMDISERYYDTDGRLKTQKIKLDRLQDLLVKADKMEDIITILSAISDTEQTIDELTGELRRYDNQVSYATISLSLEEVTRLSNVPEEQAGYLSELGGAFADGIRDFAEWVGDILLSLAYGWLWVLLFAAVVVLLWRFLRRYEKRKAQERQNAQNTQNTQNTQNAQNGQAGQNGAGERSGQAAPEGKQSIVPAFVRNRWKKTEPVTNAPQTDNPEADKPETDDTQTDTDAAPDKPEETPTETDKADT